MTAIKAITLSLGEFEKAAVSTYELGLIVNEVYKNKSFKGEAVKNLQKDSAEGLDLSRYLRTLLNEGVLFPYKDLSDIYTLLGRVDADPEDIICAIDPFCYVSHLSAMSYHALTDRIPTKIYISSPPATEWRLLAERKMIKDLGSDFEMYNRNGLPKLSRIKIKKIKKHEVKYFESKHLGSPKSVRGRSMRVSTIGRTFLEMLREPEYCGGIEHVLDVFHKYGKIYIKQIANEIDRNGFPIDKIRAGYILDEWLGLNSEIIESWTSFAQRGGSRKLDPKSEYMHEWSEKWMISLNVPGINNDY